MAAISHMDTIITPQPYINNIQRKISTKSILTENGKHHVIADTIRTGESLLTILERYKNSDIVHLCESRRQADQLAIEWNKSYKANGTNLY